MPVIVGFDPRGQQRQPPPLMRPNTSMDDVRRPLQEYRGSRYSPPPERRLEMNFPPRERQNQYSNDYAPQREYAPLPAKQLYRSPSYDLNDGMNNMKINPVRKDRLQYNPAVNGRYYSSEGAVASASPPINISFMVMKGQTIQVQIRSSPSLAEFRKVVEKNISTDVDDYRFIIESKQLDLFDSSRFNMQKSLIQNGVTIFVLQRMKGGSRSQNTQSYMEVAKIIDEIKQYLPQELERSMHRNAICVACQETKKCAQLCCWPICAECFITYYKSTNFNLKCTDCHKLVQPRQFFKSESFLRLIDCLHQSRKMLEYINFQICRCGSLMSNDTMYSKQQCNACGRNICFFCNKDWDSNTMDNVKYTCHNNCDYETKITYELLPCLEFDPNLKIPSRRTCPKCFYTGAFGGRCKYHNCYSCGYTFCFICLESKDECQQKFNKTRNQEFHKVQCREIKEQTYDMFPRIA
ncbi:unnamed protein product [Adineta ricciae]|uniref:Ubiquitin-like domain-containing protein n=1 Tax=Adineta ricciae TaxID=249248 RepID=A0A815DS45_ADIRI|nr:unnamed protein product [Adineta ricciae]